MRGRTSRLIALIIVPAALFAVSRSILAQDAAQTLSTIGAGAAGESTAKGQVQIPTGPAPRLPNGHIDFSGVWDHPYVPDMSVTNARTPALQKGAGDLPYTLAGRQNIDNYNPERDGDYTGMCMPFGLML